MGRKEIGGREWGEEKGKMRGEEKSWGKGEREEKRLGKPRKEWEVEESGGEKEGENESREGE